jgi:shikimate kinase
MAKSIAIVGMDGSGREIVGSQLARRLNWQFFDTRMHMQNASLMSVPEMISWHGELAFREFETTMIRALARQNCVVLSVDARTLANAAAREALSEKCLLVMLTADPAVSMRRNADSRIPGHDCPEADDLSVRRFDLELASVRLHADHCALSLDTSHDETQAVELILSRIQQSDAAGS